MAAIGLIAIRVCYWLDQHRFPTLQLCRNPFLGHVVLFLSRLNFVCAGAVFSTVYLVRFNEIAVRNSLWDSGYSSAYCSPYSGQWLDGGKPYVLHVPANPVRLNSILYYCMVL
jgi:hypothetical protein